MAFRRSAPSRGRSFKRRSFSRNRTHQPKRTGHWQRANLALSFENIIENPATEPTNLVAVLAQITNHLGDDSTASGRLESSTVKFLEIGGIVFDWQMMLTDLVQDFGSPPTYDVALFPAQMLIVSDRLDVDGNPCSIVPNWFSSTVPIPVANAIQLQDLDDKFPTRVHWRHSRTLVQGYGDFPALGGNFQTSQPVVLAQGSANLRLRLALDDEHCLAMHFGLNTGGSASTVTAAAVTLNVFGSMYYRIRY